MMNNPKALEQVDCFYFYFDVIGIVERYQLDKKIFDRVLEWQRAVRDIPIGCKKYRITFADNVLVRFEANDNYPIDFNVLQFAGNTMQAARKFGFENFFGVVTKGVHEFAPIDRTLVSEGFDPTDLSEQHLDLVSDPYLRAVLAEKWSGYLAKKNLHPGVNAVWVSTEVISGTGKIGEMYYGQTLSFTDLGISFDLQDSKFASVKPWPFPESQFQLIS